MLLWQDKDYRQIPAEHDRVFNRSHIGQKIRHLATPARYLNPPSQPADLEGSQPKILHHLLHVLHCLQSMWVCIRTHISPGPPNGCGLSLHSTGRVELPKSSIRLRHSHVTIWLALLVFEPRDTLVDLTLGTYNEWTTCVQLAVRSHLQSWFQQDGSRNL